MNKKLYTNRFWTKVRRVMILKQLKDKGILKSASLSATAHLLKLTGANPARQVQLYLRDISELENAQTEADQFVSDMLEE